MLLVGQYIMISIEMATHQPVEKIQPKEFSPLGSISIWKPQRKHSSICRNSSARVCDKLNEKDRKDTSRIHFLKLKPILFLIFSLRYLNPDLSQVML